MEKVLSYIESNRKRHLDEMIECVKFQTISALPEKEPEIRRCGEWLTKKLKGLGFENAGLRETEGGTPVVYAEWMKAGKDKPTIMVYGHLDVQPVDPIEKWNTPPFDPVIKDGIIYGRGTSDDKAQFLTHFFAIESLIKTEGKLPVNVKVFLESGEEGNCEPTHKFVEKNKDLLACDAVIIADTAWPTPEKPTMIYALRGIAYFQVEISGPNKDLHSGVYGGKVQNPLNAMAKIIAKLHDENGKITIPGIYDDVAELTNAERQEFAQVGESEDSVMKDLGVNALWGEKGYTATERNWARPSFDVNGIWGGYQGEGSKTVIPSTCGFKISMRLAPNQKVEKVRRTFDEYLKKICPPGITLKLSILNSGEPVMVSPDSPYITCAKKSFEKAFGKRPILVREGASIPITATFMKALGALPVMMGLGLNDDNIHSPNEHFRLDHFYKGIVASAHFFNDVQSVKGK